MTTVTFYHQNDFPAVLKWQAIAFMRVEWPFIFTGAGKFMAEPYPPEHDPVHFAATEGDSLLSYATVLRLTLDHAGVTYRMCGFGNMFTFPPYRKQGYGRQVLKHATRFIMQSDADIAMLLCDPARKTFYQSSGWEAIDSPTYVGSLEHTSPRYGLKMMLFVSSKGKAGREAFATQPLTIPEEW